MLQCRRSEFSCSPLVTQCFPFRCFTGIQSVRCSFTGDPIQNCSHRYGVAVMALKILIFTMCSIMVFRFSVSLAFNISPIRAFAVVVQGGHIELFFSRWWCSAGTQISRFHNVLHSVFRSGVSLTFKICFFFNSRVRCSCTGKSPPPYNCSSRCGFVVLTLKILVFTMCSIVLFRFGVRSHSKLVFTTRVFAVVLHGTPI